VTFLIGNGFDLQMGLKSRFTDFYDEYTKDTAGDTELIRWFKDTILREKVKDWGNWADFELGMGKQSIMFKAENCAEDFITCLDHFAENFHDYLDEECQKIIWDEVGDDIIRKFIESIACFRGRKMSMSKRNRSAMYQGILHTHVTTVNFLQFNYTNIFDNLIEKSMDKLDMGDVPFEHEIWKNVVSHASNLHIHSTLGNYPAIGVNGEDQIHNAILRNDEEVVGLFVKRNHLAALQNVQSDNPILYNQSISIISISDIICAFGTSIGETDKDWWKLVGEWLKDERKYLVIFDIYGGNDNGKSPRELRRRFKRQDKILAQFRAVAEFDEEEWVKVTPRIFVELDSKMFDFKLPMKSDADIPTSIAPISSDNLVTLVL
jgi:hypothetical protein